MDRVSVNVMPRTFISYTRWIELTLAIDSWSLREPRSADNNVMRLGIIECKVIFGGPIKDINVISSCDTKDERNEQAFNLNLKHACMLPHAT